MKKKKRIVLWICLGVLAIGLAGCRSAQKQEGYHLRQDYDLSTITKVAVLPLDNLTGDKNAAEAVRQVLINELLIAGVVDVSMPGDTVAALEKVGARNTSAMTEDQIKKVGAALRVQAVIFGAVEKYGELRTGTYSAPEVAITLMMADAQTGTILWSVTRSSVGDSFMARHFGARSETLTETMITVVRMAIGTLKGH